LFHRLAASHLLRLALEATHICVLRLHQPTTFRLKPGCLTTLEALSRLHRHVGAHRIEVFSGALKTLHWLTALVRLHHGVHGVAVLFVLNDLSHVWSDHRHHHFDGRRWLVEPLTGFLISLLARLTHHLLKRLPIREPHTAAAAATTTLAQPTALWARRHVRAVCPRGVLSMIVGTPAFWLWARGRACSTVTARNQKEREKRDRTIHQLPPVKITT
jgi:hypothetical protein